MNIKSQVVIKKVSFFIGVIILFSFISFISLSKAGITLPNWVINGSSVYVNNSNVFISVTPHSITGDGYVYFNLTSKVYVGDIDIIFGFNSSQIRPVSSEYYFNDFITNQVNYTCNGDYFNYTLNPKHFWCWDIVSSFSNETNLSVDSYSLIYEHDFLLGNLSTKTVFWYESSYLEWRNIDFLFTKIFYNYADMNVWYYSKGINVNKNQPYSFRIKLDVVPKFNQGGKYWVAVKPSSKTLQDAISQGFFYALDPWWNSTYNKKKQINITENSAKDMKQIQVYLNVSYDNDMNHDFSDLRFVDSSESVELSYYIENYTNGTNAYVWVKTNLTASSVNSFFMYYDNSSVVLSQSNPDNTFHFWEDFDSYSDYLSINASNSNFFSIESFGINYIDPTNKAEGTKSLNITDNIGNGVYICRKSSGGVLSQGFYRWYHRQNSIDAGKNPSVFVCNDDAGGCGVYGILNKKYWQQSTGFNWVSLQYNSSDVSRYVYQNGTSNSFVVFDGAVDLGSICFSVSDGSGATFGQGYIDAYARGNWTFPEPTYLFGTEMTIGDSTSPLVTINTPLNQTYGTTTITFNVTATDETAMSNCTYQLDNSNYTMTNLSSYWSSVNTTMTQGGHNTKFFCNDSSNNVNSTQQVQFTVDTIFPLISIITPSNNTNSSNTGLDVDYTATDTNRQACWYSNDTMTINTTLVSCDNITTIVWNEGNHIVTVWVNDTANNINLSSVSFFIDSINPSASNIVWSTTGGFIDNTFNYNQILDWVAVTASDTNLKGVNITVLSPSTTVVSSQPMVNNTLTNWNYTSDITLNTAGTWNVSITAYDRAGNLNQTNLSFSVSTQNLTTQSGWYGCSHENISSSSEINTFSSYECDLIELEDTISTLTTNWNTLLIALNNSNDENVRVGINYRLDFNYSLTSEKINAMNNITASFPDLKNDPYSDTVEYISFELVNASSYTDAEQYGVLNSLAENATNAFNNIFVIFSKNYNSSNLDNSYISITTMLYVSDTTQSDLVNTENSLLKYNSSLNRVYVNFSDTLMTQTKDYQLNIIAKLRGLPKIDSTVSNSKVAEIDTVVHDIVVFNNLSTATQITVNVTNVSSASGKDVWDSTNNFLVEVNTDTVFNVNVSAYSATMIFLDDIDHIQLTSLTESSVYKGGISNTSPFNYTNGTTSGSWTLYGANDIRVELFDPHYKLNTFLIYYGWINASYVSKWSSYGIIVFDDEQTAAVSTLLSATTTTDLFCYMSVADYSNSAAWNSAKNVEVDNCLALNASTRLNIFIDGLDIGAGGTNFSARIKDLVNYVKITKGRKAGLNTYTAYANFCSWTKPDGFCLKESCVGRWNGVNPNAPDNYTWENWTLELQKASWYQNHNVDVLCQAYDNRTISDSSQQITNRTKVQDMYFASLVLGYDSFYLSQPDFNYAHEIYVYDAGNDLATTYSTTDNITYYRAYSNGIVYYNSSSNHGWIDDGKAINTAQACFNLIDNSDAPSDEDGNICFNINKDNDNCDYNFTATEVVWSANGNWYCKNISTSDIALSSGSYYINMHMQGRGQSADGIAVTSQSNYDTTGRHSWWDNTAGGVPYTWNVYAQNQNWMASILINDTKKASIDTTTVIEQVENTVGSYTNVTLSSNYTFNTEIWSNFVSIDLTSFTSMKYWNNSEFVAIYPQYTSDCDTNLPTFNSTTIASEVHKACYEDTGFRVASPSLSTRTYQVQSNVAPTYTSFGTNDTTPEPSASVNFYAYWSDANGNLSTYIFSTNNTGTWINDSAVTFSDVNNSWSNKTLTINNTPDVVIGYKFFANDTDNEMNSTSINVVTVTDTIAPNLVLTSPQNNSSYNYNTSIMLNYTVSDSVSVNRTWYYVLNSSSGYEISNTTLTTNITFNVSESGNYTLYLYANDTSNNINFTSAIFSIDTVAPTISILSPTSGADYNYYNILFSITAADSGGISARWYNVNNGTNVTFDGDEYVYLGVENTYNVTFWVNDSAGNKNSTFIVFTISDLPGATVTSPGSAGTSLSKIFKNFTLTYNSVWKINTAEGVKIKTYDKNMASIDVININAVYDNKYIEGRNVTRYNVGVYEKQFDVKDKVGNITISFLIDDVTENIAIEITDKEEIDEKLDNFIDKGVTKFENFVSILLDKFGILLIVIILFFILFMIIVLSSILTKTLKRK